MNFTECLGLPCPDPEDYGAYALYMQRVAEMVEAHLLAQQELATTFDMPRTTIWNNDEIIGPIDTTGFASLQQTSSDVVFSNVQPPFPFPLNGLNIGTNPGTFLEPGIYHIGWSINTVEVGAVTNDSLRRANCIIEKNVPGGPLIVAEFNRAVQAENIAGGSFFGSEGTFVVDEDFGDYVVQITWLHGNVASMVQIPVGGYWIWLTRVGSVEAIEVV